MIDTVDLIILVSIGWLIVSCGLSGLAYHQGKRDAERYMKRHRGLGRAGTDRELP